MALKIATIGDRTTTGGVILDGASSVYAEGRLVALIGSKGTCTVCSQGGGPIRQTHPHTVEVEGRQVCLHGSIVECGCPPGTNRVIASASMESIGFEGGQMVARMSLDKPAPNAPAISEQIATASATPIPVAICPAERDELQDGVFLWTETVDAGHAFVSIHRASKPTVFTYGRFGERGIVPTVGEGVMIRLSEPAAVKYYQHELYRMGAKVFKILDADRDVAEHYLNMVYLSGSRSPKTNRQDSSRYGRVIDTYDLTGNNCTTHSVKALHAAGSAVFKVQRLGVQYTEDFTIPASLQQHLQQVNASASMAAMDVTEQFKEWYPSLGGVVVAEDGGVGSIVGAGADSAGVAGSSTGYSGGTFGGSSGGLYEQTDR
ncbi:TPA: PAAR domain-containing protein [Aeromonas hydrophila]|nr:PAAR domain-containing protein [Aeromonas hydrophila]HAT2638889.1 PAAR domain-containing protein [Aeromonas hydrophila]HAT3423989.1 PAAR domain-containing protein [Aeromonas hydrophila]HAT3534025.1 PAAR domain-containing protein [Aeromonas hydrophila]